MDQQSRCPNVRRLWLVAAALIGLAAPAISQQQCLPREALIDALGREYPDEVQSWVGIVSESVVFELWVAPDGTWTLIRSVAGGFSCVMATGLSSLGMPKFPLPGEDI